MHCRQTHRPAWTGWTLQGPCSTARPCTAQLGRHELCWKSKLLVTPNSVTSRHSVPVLDTKPARPCRALLGASEHTQSCLYRRELLQLAAAATLLMQHPSKAEVVTSLQVKCLQNAALVKYSCRQLDYSGIKQWHTGSAYCLPRLHALECLEHASQSNIHQPLL